MPVDLHLHTTASDGSLNPRRLVELAATLGITVIAVSDHDTVNGIDEALATGKSLGVEVIPAIELSSKYNSRDVHILGFFIGYKNEQLLASLKHLRDARFERAKKIINCLQGLGLDISMDEIKTAAGPTSVGRPHIARILLAKGYVSSFGDAFTKYLKNGAPCYFEKFVYSTKEAISLIHKSGGIAVFAHPGLAKLDEHIPELVEMGLDGIEAYHSEHTPEMTERYKAIAKDYGLIITGGSDCHGESSSRGLRMGTVYVPDEVAEGLKVYYQKKFKII